ncbi:MAG: C39 family peptidase, partial [Candidatus Pacebacteria bacterium]|nr:C39 family peptidase [Candidatus Paceibacterota bacterium]
MKTLFVSLVLLVLLSLTIPSTIGALGPDEGALTTWANIKANGSAKLAPPVGSYTKLVVPFYPQVPPGDWGNTMNCGQASVLICVGYAKRVCYPYPGPLITKENEWLAKTYKDSRYLDPNGYYTGGSRISYLEALARDYWGFKNSKATTNSCSSIDVLYSELKADRPVVVEVMTGMASKKTDGVDYHFMVLVGIKIGADDANSYVWV